MDQNQNTKLLSEMAAELFYLREDAKVAGEPFLASLIGMAAIEAERLSEEPVRSQAEGLLDLALAGAAGEAEKPSG